MDSLQSSYNSWPLLSSKEKIDLLAKTERKIAKASTEKVAEFCLHVLSKISFEHECNQNSDLITPVKNLGLRVQAKSSSIFFSTCTLTEAEHAAYILNGKNPYLAMGAAPIKASSAISESRWAFSKFGESSIDLGSDISQETCKTILILFNKSQQEQIEALQAVSCKEFKKIKKAADRFIVRGDLKAAMDNQLQAYLANKKKTLFIERLNVCDSEQDLMTLFEEFDQFNSFPHGEKLLLRCIEAQYSDESTGYLSDEAIEMLCWYLLKTRDEKFYPPFDLKQDSALCFAHAKIIADEFRKNPIDEILGIKHTYLQWLIYGKVEEYLSIFSQSMAIYSAKEIQRILATIDSIFALEVNSSYLRRELVKIVQAVPYQKRVHFTHELFSKNYFLSDADPLYLFFLEELERTGEGSSLVPFLFIYQDVKEVIRFLNKLASLHPKNALVFGKSILACVLQCKFKREEYLFLFRYILTINPDIEFASDVITYMKTAILTLKFNLSALYPDMEAFYEKIKYFSKAHEFQYLACEYAVKNTEFHLALKIADWSKNVKTTNSSEISMREFVLSSAEKMTPLDIVKFIINQKEKLSKPEFGDEVLRLIALSDCLKNEEEEPLNLFQENKSGLPKEKAMQMEFLTRSNRIFPCEERFLTLKERCFLSLAFHLWQDKNDNEATCFILELENGGNSILFPFLEKISGFEKNENYEKLVLFAYREYSKDIVPYLIKSKKFTEFHQDLMNHFKAKLVLSKKSF